LNTVHIMHDAFFCGKYCHNSIENDYCGGKPGLSLLLLVLTLTLTFILNPKDLTNSNSNPTLLTLID